MKASEAECMAFIVQGGLLVAAREFIRQVRQPAKVVQTTAEDGFYEPYFLLELASGIVLRVSVTVEREAAR